MKDVSNNDEDIHQADPELTSHRQSGDTVFSAILVLLAVFLLSQIGSQTKWIDGIPILKQPRFWPGLCLGGFFIFSVGNLIQSLRDGRRSRESASNYRILPWDELFNWIKTIEFAVYFLIYVYSVPIIGYLPSTLLFCPLMTIRVGYKGFRFPAWSILAGFVIVFLFKTILSVKLPAGELYNIFPDQIRNILILYF